MRRSSPLSRSDPSKGIGRLVLALACLAVSAPALAGDREQSAAEVFRTGSKAYARGDYRAAALAFEAAFREVPRAPSMYNAARAWERAGESARAADDYDAAIATGELGAEDAADANARLAALERGAGTVEAVGPPGAWISLAHAERARMPARIHVAPGDYEARVGYADGRIATRSVHASGGVRVHLDTSPPEAASPPASSVPPPKPIAPTAAAAHDARAHGSAIVTAGWVSLGASAVAGGAAVILGLEALHARDLFDAGGWRDQAEHDRAAAFRTWTNVAWVAAGALAVTGVVFLIAAPRSSTRAQRAATQALSF